VHLRKKKECQLTVFLVCTCPADIEEGSSHGAGPGNCLFSVLYEQHEQLHARHGGLIGRLNAEIPTYDSAAVLVWRHCLQPEKTKIRGSSLQQM